MKRFGFVIVCVMLFTAGFYGCTRSISNPPDTSGSVTDTETEEESALCAAKEASAANDTRDGDIIIVYDGEIMVTSCYKVRGGEVEMLCKGDYQGSYDNLDCIAEGEYNDWDVLIYRQKTAQSAALTKPELDDLAKSIFSSYLRKYGALKAGSFICLTEPDGTLYQYVSLTEGGVEYIDETDVRYNMWQSSENADNYWAKYVHDDPYETSWEVYEYDVQCSKAFEKIADLTELLGEVQDGTVFVCTTDKAKVIMRYSEGAVFYIQANDWQDMEEDFTLQETGSIKSAPKNVEVFIPKEG